MARGNQKIKTKGSTGLNKKNAADFMDKNRHKTGVFETESGLQYVIVDTTENPGKQPALEDTVTVQQRISLLDGTVIEDTYQKPDPATFSMQEAIEGYQEGLSLMKTGDRFKLTSDHLIRFDRTLLEFVHVSGACATSGHRQWGSLHGQNRIPYEPSDGVNHGQIENTMSTCQLRYLHSLGQGHQGPAQTSRIYARDSGSY
jgi:FKBP-type peptidyl-prolyl cis-trans isomerase FkpA